MTTATTSPAIDDQTTVRLVDHLTGQGLADLRWYLHDLVLAGARTIVVDMSSATGVESTTLAALIGTHRSCRARGGGVVLRDPGPQALDLIRRTGLWRVFRIEHSTRGTRRA
ncbi:MAG: STAS domain-containing protein [Actinomycetia bacterium]|nr:STAS domain-containing protein [Actinomycetes bacterium]